VVLTLALGALAVVLAFAMIRPRGWPEAVVALPVAGALVATGVVSWQAAAAEVTRLLPVVGFLAAVLVLAKLCDDEGLFHAAGVGMARRSDGEPRKLLVTVFVIAACTTAVLSLDATVVLLTPVVLATARTLGTPARPHAYASAHLANTASLLLPVSNLTNLLAFGAAGLSFAHFSALMTLPWLLAVGVEYAMLRFNWPRAPFVIGLVLGRVSEESLHKALGLWGWQFFLRPLSLVLIGLIVATIAFAIYRQTRKPKPASPQLSVAQ